MAEKQGVRVGWAHNHNESCREDNEGTVLEVGRTAYAKALSRKPQLPLCSLRGLTGVWVDAAWPLT